MSKNLLKIKEDLVTDSNAAEKITFAADDKIVGVTIKNQGASTVVSGFNTESPVNEILPNSSEPYGLDGYYLVGDLKIQFSGVGTNKAIVKYFIDQGEYCP